MLKTPPMQTATATIDNYCSRLQSATLLEDRRAAIEGLRSVAKQYPASVASGSLRELILTLRRDGVGQTTRRRDDESREEEGGDVDTIRLVLETLVRLFEPEPDSPEAGEEIALFMADEFCMRQENTALLLNLLDPTAPYSDNLSIKLSVQILTAICASRPERLQEAILGAPLGVSRLVGVLDNPRDDVRYAGLELLTVLTGGTANEELRKIVAFEDVFGRVFNLIQLEGGLAEARIVVQDCLTLLINLVRGSVSNQTMFRESGGISQLADLLKEVFPSEEAEAPFVAENRVRGGWGLLQLLRQLLAPGEPSTPQNQSAFFRAGISQILVNIAFHHSIPSLVKESALRTVADLIRGNAPIQVNFASTQVDMAAPKKEDGSHLQVNGTQAKGQSARSSARQSLDKQPVYIIEALLGLMLQQQRVQYELRVAGCAVIQAYLAGHLEIRQHFLQRAIAGHKEGEQAPNVLTSLLHSSNDDTSVVLSGWTVQDLVDGNRDAKSAFADVKEGEASEGEDVLTAIATLGSVLQDSLQKKVDATLVAAYITTLCILLWDFADGINDLLAEGSSTIQALVESAKTDVPVIRGLAATLLGIVYEFSTKDSPIPRKTLSTLLTQKLGRDKYLTALSGLRSDPAIRDFDLAAGEVERLQLSESFFNLFLNEYPRLRRAIDKDPGIEVLSYAAAEAGVQRDVLDELRNKITALETSLSQQQQAAAETSKQAQQDKLQTEQRLASLQKDSEQERFALQKELRTATSEAERIRTVIAKMQTNHEEDIKRAQLAKQRELEEGNVKHARELATFRQEAERKAQQAKQQAEQGFVPVRQDFERRLAEINNAHRTEQAAHSTTRGQLEIITNKHAQAERQTNESAQRLKSLGDEHTAAQKALEDARTRATTAEASLAAAQETIAGHSGSVEILEKEVKQLQSTSAGRETELQDVKKTVADLQSQLDAERAKVAAGSAELAKQLEAERKKATDIEEKYAQAEKKATAAEAKTKELEGQLKDAQKKHSTIEQELEKVKADAKKSADVKTTKKDADAAAKKTDMLKQLSDKLAEEVKKLKADAELTKEKEASHMSELKASQKSVSDAQEAEKSAKEELDNLLLVMSDIEAKRDEYRAKVKELGGEVSDDDEEEDDDEDEEDNSDDVD